MAVQSQDSLEMKKATVFIDRSFLSPDPGCFHTIQATFLGRMSLDIHFPNPRPYFAA
jgi:hypothetical protein